MKFWKHTLVLLSFLLLSTSSFAVDVVLYDWAFNANGLVSEGTAFPPDPLPSELDDSAFDWITGLGKLSVSHTAAADETYSFITFLDHEIDEAVNSFFNEYGAVSGTPLAAQSWEIDEPGYVFGDIYGNVLAGSLDNFNNVSDFWPADDVSMALGWEFDLKAGDILNIDFLVSDIAPLSGFYLEQYDPDSEFSLYFSSTAHIVPEPSTFLLIGVGIIGLLAGRKYLS